MQVKKKKSTHVCTHAHTKLMNLWLSHITIHPQPFNYTLLQQASSNEINISKPRNYSYIYSIVSHFSRSKPYKVGSNFEKKFPLSTNEDVFKQGYNMIFQVVKISCFSTFKLRQQFGTHKVILAMFLKTNQNTCSCQVPNFLLVILMPMNWEARLF